MNNQGIEVTEVTTGRDNDESKRKYLLSNESFEQLCLAQQRINRETEMTPSLRKLINELVNKEAVSSLIDRYIERLN